MEDHNVFAQPDQASAHETIERICRLFDKRYPQLVKVVQEAGVDVLAYFSFPVEHRRQIWSTNSLERLNKEVSRRCDVVGIFPNRASLLRLSGAVLEEQTDEWAVGRRYFSTESMNKLYQPTNEEVVLGMLELQRGLECRGKCATGITPAFGFWLRHPDSGSPAQVPLLLRTGRARRPPPALPRRSTPG
jgi:hypothetical protein